MAKNTKDAESNSAFTPRSVEALEQIQDQLDGKHGGGQIKTGVDITLERNAEDRERLGL